MGSGKKSAAKVAVIGAAVDMEPMDDEMEVADEIGEGPEAQVPGAALTTPSAIAEKLAGGGYSPNAYGAIQLVHDAQQAAQSHDDWTAWKDEVASGAAQFLAGLPPEDLKKAALAAGFKYPSLAGSSDGGKAGSLVFWLNPGYTSPGALMKKSKVQSAISAKFEALSDEEKAAVLAQEQQWADALAAAGVQVAVEGSEGVKALEPVSEEEFQERVAATVQLGAALLQKITDKADLSEEEWAAALDEFQQAAAKVAGAFVPGQQPGWLSQQKELAAFAESFKQFLHQNVYLVAYDKHFATFAAVLGKKAAEAHEIPPVGMLALTKYEIAALWDPLTPGDVKASLAKKAKDAAPKISENIEKLQAGIVLLAEPEPEADKLFATVAEVKEVAEELKPLIPMTSAGQSFVAALTGTEVPTYHYIVSDLAYNVKEAVDGMGMGALRATAVGFGLPASVAYSKKATKAQLKAFIAGKALGTLAPGSVQNKLKWAEKKLGALQGTTQTTAPPPSKAPQAPAKATKPAPFAVMGVAFQERIQALKGILQQRAAAAKLPQWKGREYVQSLALHHEGSASHLGGVHEKHFYRDPSGQRYLFKPDKHSGGAVAAAEEAAAELARKIGLPSVEVRKVRIGGRDGALQPFLSNAKPMSADPVHWTPDQRQGVMMHHVVDWLTGDHDGNPSNFILVDGNTPIRIDRGQAFKFIGSDRLDLDYEPNKQHGAAPHAATLLYRAVKSGKIQVDPRTVLPVIQAIEKMPDEEYRSILRPVAEHGAKSKKAAWYQAMEERAAKAKKGGKATAAEVAEAFLDAALERKKTIRETFEAFFSKTFGQPFAFGA